MEPQRAARSRLWAPGRNQEMSHYSNTDPSIFVDMEKEILETAAKVLPYTITSYERIYTLCKSVEYIVKNKIPGGFVECGVFKGGSMMAIADTLRRLGDTSRDLYLLDTFKGMPAPTAVDVSAKGIVAAEYWRSRVTDGSDHANWCNAPLESVKEAMALIDYPADKLHYIVGKVENTLPEHAPESLALVRLDTDFYESTKHELIHLYPRLNKGGVLIIDDYGFWKGSARATEEYIAENNIPILLTRVDDTGRIGIKPY